MAQPIAGVMCLFGKLVRQGIGSKHATVGVWWQLLPWGINGLHKTGWFVEFLWFNLVDCVKHLLYKFIKYKNNG